MLYKFQCKKSADVLMLGDLTQLIFDIIERPLENKGVFLVEQLEPTIKKLEFAITRDMDLRKALDSESLINDSEKAAPKADRLGQRVFPFIQLLKTALSHKEMVIWGA